MTTTLVFIFWWYREPPTLSQVECYDKLDAAECVAENIQAVLDVR